MASANPPRFSVLIPTYNYRRYVGRAIASVLGQSDCQFHLLVIDDASTDDTRQEVERAAGGDPRVRYHRFDKRCGPYSACRWGVLETPADEWVVFLDADDRMQSGYLEAAARAIASDNRVRMVFPRVVNVREDGRQVAEPPVVFSADPPDNFRRFIEGRLAVCAGGSILHRSVIDRPLEVFLPWKPFHGFDRVLIAQGLAWYHAAGAPDAVIEVHHHEGRMRDDINSFLRDGATAADSLFDDRLIPAQVMGLADRFRQRLTMEQGRLLYRHRRFREAAAAYRKALAGAWWRGLADRTGRRGLRRWAVAAAMSRVVGNASAETVVKTDTPGAAPGPHQPVEPIRVASLGGSARDVNRRFVADGLGLITEAAALGDIVRLPLWGGTWLVNEPAAARYVLTKQALNYHKVGFQRDFSAVFGFSLTNIEGEDHRFSRKSLAADFQDRSLRWTSRVTDRHLREISSSLPHAQPFNLADLLMRSFAGLSGELMHGVTDESTVRELSEAVRTAHRGYVMRSRCPVAISRWWPGKGWRRERRGRRRLDAVMQRLIGERRRSLAQHGPDHGESVRGVTLLDRLILLAEQSPDQWPDRRIRDFATAIFVAGYEPITNTVGWAIHRLGMDEVLQRAVRDEGRSLPDLLDDDFDPIENLPLSRAVVDETTRLYPAVWILPRLTLEDDALPGGVKVKRGERLAICPYTLHRRPDLYEDPDRFDAGRFTAEACRGRKPYTYIPFGGGSRVCLGEHLARRVAVLAVARLTAGHEFESAGGANDRLESVNGFTIQPVNGVLTVVARKVAATGTGKPAGVRREVLGVC